MVSLPCQLPKSFSAGQRERYRSLEWRLTESPISDCEGRAGSPCEPRFRLAQREQAIGPDCASDVTLEALKASRHRETLAIMRSVDRVASEWPVMRGLGDHVLLVMERIQA